MLTRAITTQLTNTLQRFPAVALLGARQIGKTTLAKAIGESYSSIYLDLESPEDQLKLHDPIAFLKKYRDKLIIIDEIQRAPDLFMSLRGLIDENRQRGKKSEQFLLLGSASMDLLRQSSESLAGRIYYLNMSGFHLLEVPHTNIIDRDKLWLRGGFPDSYLSDSDQHSMDWLEMLIRTYLERDIPQLGFRVPAIRLRRLWTMLAHLQGQTINHSKLGTNLSVDAKTIAHYLDILVDLLLVRRLEPWFENVKKRLIKSPRFYVRDSGLLHRLLNISDHDALLSHPVIGKSFEGFVIENILSILPQTILPYYYRTASGTEIDLVLKMPNNECYAIEIKYSTHPTISKGFHIACEDLNVTHKFVIYSGDDTFRISDNITVTSLVDFMEMIKQ